MIYRLDTPYISHIHITHISTHPLFRIDMFAPRLRVQRRGRKNSTLDPPECQGVVDWPTDSCLSGSSTRKAPTTTETDGKCWKLLLEKW